MTMQREIPFPLESYNHQSKPLSVFQVLLNLMAGTGAG